jgi:diguanylate cyclase (GGDEF)-like protein
VKDSKFYKFRYELIFLGAALAAAIFLTWVLLTHDNEMRALCQHDFEGVMFTAIFLFIAVIIFASWAVKKISYEQEVHAGELEARNNKLREFAITDGLTKVFNHRYFEHKLEKEWERFLRFKHALACVMIDIDNFKQVNDKFGHRGGDTVLRGIADLLRKNLREVDIISRYGGEEFTLLLFEKPSHTAGLKKTMEKIRKEVETAEFIFENKKIKVTVSLGGALVPNPKIHSPEKLVHFADKAMYHAKTNGKNNSAVFGEKGCC